jgi:5-methylcytosine-specific restriction enzyme B
MSRAPKVESIRPVWFVGAAYGGTDDQASRFIADAVWKNGYKNKYHDIVRSMLPGDRIAMKASYTRKHDLPFDNRGEFVSVMSIKATGTITRNVGDGQVVGVNWTVIERPREWYFFTHRGTIWRVEPGDWRTDGLISFTFEQRPQDIHRYRSASN